MTTRIKNILSAGWFLLCAGVIAFVVMTLCACEAKIGDPKPPTSLAPNQIRIGDQVITAPAGATVEFESDSESSQGSGIEKHEGSATGKGAGLTTDSQDAANNFNASAPTSWLPSIRASGGDADISSTLTGRKATSPLMWVGILCALAAGFCFWRGLRRAALVCAGMAVAFVAASMLPGWAWLIIGFGGVGVLGFYVWSEQQGRDTREATRAVVAGVETLPDPTRKAVKSAIAVHADERDKATIKSIKKADDLPSERA